MTAFCIGNAMQNKRKHAVLNPILIGAGIVMIVLCLFKIPVADYREGCKPLSYLMTPATICLGISFAEQAGGIGAVTSAAIILTGIPGNIAGPVMVKLFHLEDEIAQGVAYGTASHVIGTSRAMEHSSLAGAVGSFALTVAGLLTSLIFSVL